MKSKVIILNGVGSVGKTSIARALQNITSELFLHVQMDAFMDMLPPSAFDRSDGVRFHKIFINGKPEIVIKTGDIAERCFHGMRQAIKAMADSGNNQIVDDVLLDGTGAEYSTLLADHETYFVGVFAPLEVVEERERARGDRMIGLARWQFGKVHAGVKYDLELDASIATPEQCAALIKDRFGL